MAILLIGCAATSVKSTWKAPDHKGPVSKVAVLAVEERGDVRQALENRFRNQLEEKAQPAIVTHQLLSLDEIKEDKQKAAAEVHKAGAEAVLIVRMVDSTTRAREVRATPALFAPVTTGIGTAYAAPGWYDYYTVAFMDMGTVWGSVEQTIYLETCLFDLKNGKLIWSALTETTLRENMDRLEEADRLVAKVLAAARQDGMIR